jgi:hypothetical protein
VKCRAECFGSAFLRHIKNAGLFSVTFGVPAARHFHNRLTALSAKRLDRPAMSNDGTAPAARKTPGTREKLCHFQKQVSITNLQRASSLSAAILI